MTEGAQIGAVTATYDALARDCLQAFELREELLGRIPPARLMEVQSLPEWTVEDWRKHITDRASDELSAEMSKVATEDEKNHEFFSSVTASYWLEALAADCCTRFNLDANRIAGLSESS